MHLHTLMKAAEDNRSMSYCGVWQKGKQTYSLSIKRVEELGGTFEWRMFAGSGEGASELWFHLTDDVMLVLRMMRQALGEQLAQDIEFQAKTFARLPSLTKLRQLQNDIGTDSLSKKVTKAASSSEEIPVTATFETEPIYVSEIPGDEPDILRGRLDLVHITSLLQSISLGQMTGRLRIQRPHTSVDIFFESGKPVYASGTHSSGNESLLQVMCWKDGQFHFEPILAAPGTNITQDLNYLMLQGIKLSDNTEFLKREGVRMQSVLTRVHDKISESEFELMMSKGEPIDMELVKNFYLNVHDNRTLQEIVSLLNLQRSVWVQIIANLIRCGAVRVDKVAGKGVEAVSPEPKAKDKTSPAQAFIQPKVIDKAKLASLNELLWNEDTGILTHGAFLFLLEHEFTRTKESPFSILLFDVQPIRTGELGKEQATQFLKVLAARIREEFNGFLAHYEKDELALLIPGGTANDVSLGAEEIKIWLLSTARAAGIETSNLAIAIGIASCPDDAQNMQTLLGAVELARDEAKKTGSAIVLARHVL